MAARHRAARSSLTRSQKLRLLQASGVLLLVPAVLLTATTLMPSADGSDSNREEAVSRFESATLNPPDELVVEQPEDEGSSGQTTPQHRTHDIPTAELKSAGEQWAVITIPRFDPNPYVVLEGDTSALMGKDKLAIERSPFTQRLGEIGNTVLFGHRSLNPAYPFNDITELKEGDELTITTADGIYRYGFVSSRKFSTSDVSVLNPVPFSIQEPTDRILTLIACQIPSASGRIAAEFTLLDFTPAPSDERPIWKLSNNAPI